MCIMQIATLNNMIIIDSNMHQKEVEYVLIMQRIPENIKEERGVEDSDLISQCCPLETGARSAETRELLRLRLHGMLRGSKLNFLLQLIVLLR